MNKNLLKSKIEMASLIEKQQSEIEDLSSINRDLMIHLEAAQKINNQEKFIWKSTAMNRDVTRFSLRMEIGLPVYIFE